MKVTVLMPVYNAERFLKEAIDSILQQTFPEFEFLIINDGSTDKSSDIIESYKDSRIIHVKLARNAGIVNALNSGIALAKGEYIVRMDSDDIALPGRILRQLEFMEKHQEVGVSGTWVEYIGEKAGVIKTPHDHNEIVWGLLKGCVLFHPTVIIRSSLIKGKGITYPADYPHAEDYALWLRLIKDTRFANMQEILLQYRFSGKSVGSLNAEIQHESASRVARRIHEVLLDEKISDEFWNEIDTAAVGKINVPQVVKMYSRINQLNNLFDPIMFERKLFKRIKQMLLVKHTDWTSIVWLFTKSLKHPVFLKYIMLSAIKT